MEILSFIVSGKIAHFRKYYANNTAFSFSIPPRTTLIGLIAGIMGWAKDSYYERLSSEHIQIGIRTLYPVKKSFQRLNYLKVDNTSDFRGRQGRTQIPFEVVTPLDIRNGEVAYQVFIKASESGELTFQELKNHLLYKEPVYATSLGAANFTAQIKEIHLFASDNIEAKQSDDFIFIHTAVPVDLVEALNFEKEAQDCYNFVEEDMLPGDFIGNYNREVKKMNQLLFSTTSTPLRVILKGKYWSLKKEREIINIQFMDS